MYLVAPLHCELADIGEERVRDVSLALADVPGADDWPGLGLGFQEDGLERPAAIILHTDAEPDSPEADEVTAAITDAAVAHGLTVHTVTAMGDDFYEALTLEQCVVTPRDELPADAADELGEDA